VNAFDFTGVRAGAQHSRRAHIAECDGHAGEILGPARRAA
jgi:hypothetical protein